MAKRLRDFTEHLPNELSTIILYYVDDRIQCSFVCKFWKSLVDGSGWKVEKEVRKKPRLYACTLIAKAQSGLLKWAHSRGCPIYDGGKSNFSARNHLAIAAAKVGRFDIVDWVVAQGVDISGDYVRAGIAKHAAKFDNKEVMRKMLHMRDTVKIWCLRDIARKAIQHNRQPIYNYLVGHYGKNPQVMPELINGRCCGLARTGYLCALKCDIAMRIRLHLDMQLITTHAIIGDQVEVVELCYANHPLTNFSACRVAARYGSLRVMIWLTQHGHEPTQAIYSRAVKYKHHKLAKWLLDNQKVKQVV